MGLNRIPDHMIDQNFVQKVDEHTTQLAQSAKKQSGWIDVTESPYNADKTGATSASAAINSAISTCIANGGGEVLIPPGSYLLDATVNIVGIAVKINAHGAVFYPKASFGGGTMFKVGNAYANNVWQVELNGLTIHQNYSGNVAFGIGILLDGAQADIVGCSISSGDIGVKCMDAYRSNIRDGNKITGNRVGVYLGTNSNSISVKGNAIDANTETQVYVNDSEGSSIEENTLQGGQRGIHHDSTGIINGLSIKKNYFENNSINNIKLGVNQYATEVVIEGNFVNNNSTLTNSIVIGATQYTKIAGNKFVQDQVVVPPLTIISSITRKVIECDCEFNDLAANPQNWQYTFIKQTPGRNYDYEGYSNNTAGFVKAYLDRAMRVFTGGTLNPDNATTSTFLNPLRAVFDSWHRELLFNTSGKGVRLTTDAGIAPSITANEAAAPVNGSTYPKGSVILDSNAVAGGKVGKVAVTAGTQGTLSGVTINISGYVTNHGIVNDITNLAVGQYINVVGDSAGYHRITAITPTKDVYVSPSFSMGSGTTTGAAVSFGTPAFKPFGVIDA